MGKSVVYCLRQKRGKEYLPRHSKGKEKLRYDIK